jgi:hypothetical protein
MPGRVRPEADVQAFRAVSHRRRAGREDGREEVLMRVILWLERHDVEFFLGMSATVGLMTWWFGL